MSLREPDSADWRQEFYSWPDDLSKILSRIESCADKSNVYFSAHLFSSKSALKTNVLPSRTIQADLDDAIVPSDNAPSILVETSPNRHQGFWFLKEVIAPTDLELVSKSVTYGIPDSDHSGWSLGHKMRVPNTLNYKYATGPKLVKVINSPLTQYTGARLGANVAINIALPVIESFTPEPLSKGGPRELWSQIKPSLIRRIQAQYDVQQQDRSAALWGLMLALFRAGLSRDQVFWLAQGSANNKFKDNLYHADIDLVKDVLRAERAIRSGASEREDIRARIAEARRMPGASAEKKQFIASLVQKGLLAAGGFISTDDGQDWYIREDTGRPITISKDNDYFNSLLDTRFGLNATESEQRYTIQALISFIKESGPQGQTAALTYYDPQQNTILIHSGRKDVLHITPTTIEARANGSTGILFPWRPNEDPFDPDLEHPLSIDSLFEGCFDNLNEMPGPEAAALVKAWLYFLFFRNDAISRPILALFGQPGCLSEETIIDVRRGEHSARQFSLEEAYKAFHGRWNKSIPSRIMSVKDNVSQWRNIKDIIRSGKKTTYTVRVEHSLGTIRATLDHKFLTPDGYKKLQDLNVGDKVIVQGVPLSTLSTREHHSRRIVTATYHPYSREKLVNGYGPYYSILYCRAVVDASLSGLSTEQFLKIVNIADITELKKLRMHPRNIIIHHKDENPENDLLENLEILTKIEHDTYHGHKNVKNFGLFSGMYNTMPSTILSIEKYGEEQTYDIEMEDEEAPNFIVNNVVVHNSGKSSLFRRIYALLYGTSKAVNAISTAEHFDQAVSSDPMVVFDNVDTWAPWLPDKLALSAGKSDLVKRKLYTDNTNITLKRQALIGLTAHNPKFRREDVVDRLLIISLHRLKDFTPETDIINKVVANRDRLWGGVVTDLQKILATPQLEEVDLPRFRVSDFSRIGVRIARALDFEDAFREALASNVKEQTSYNLEEEDILVDTIKIWMMRPSFDKEKYYSSGELWTQWIETSRDPHNFARIYKNAVTLGKKLWTLQEALSSIVAIDFNFNDSGVRKWRFSVR